MNSSLQKIIISVFVAFFAAAFLGIVFGVMYKVPGHAIILIIACGFVGGVLSGFLTNTVRLISLLLPVLITFQICDEYTLETLPVALIFITSFIPPRLIPLLVK